MKNLAYFALILAAVFVFAPRGALAIQPGMGPEVRVDDLEQEVAALKERIKELEAEKAELEREANRAWANYNKVDHELKALKGEYEGLKSASGEYEKLRKTQEELKAAVAQIKKLSQEGPGVAGPTKVVPRDNTLRWFLAGGVVFLVGLIVGRVLGRGTRKYKSSLDI